MSTARLSRDYLVHEYIEHQRSTYEIAEECHTYPNLVRRTLIKYGIPLRDKSEAQKIALAQGRHKHPTKGIKRPIEVRTKISKNMRKEK